MAKELDRRNRKGKRSKDPNARDSFCRVFSRHEDVDP